MTEKPYVDTIIDLIAARAAMQAPSSGLSLCTTRNAQQIAIAMSRMTNNDREMRIEVLRRIFPEGGFAGRIITSAKDLSAAQADALLFYMLHDTAEIAHAFSVWVAKVQPEILITLGQQKLWE